MLVRDAVELPERGRGSYLIDRLMTPDHRPSMSASSEARLIDSQAGQFAFYLWQNVTIIVWQAQATGPAVARLTAASLPVAASHAEGISSVHIIRQGVGMPTQEARLGLVESATQVGDRLACVGVVLLGAGFWASALRGRSRACSS